MPRSWNRSPSRHGPGGYRGATQAAARAQFSAERREVVNANIVLNPSAETCPAPTKEKPKCP
jgi:hypothetical protein